MWVERDWHCPVVVEARSLRVGDTNLLRVPDELIDKRNIVTNRAIAATHENIWRRDQVADLGVKFIAWDLTGHYPETPGRPAGDPAVIAQWVDPNAAENKWGGAFALAGRCDWTEAEVRPDVLLGAYPDPAQRQDQAALWSTFRVIKAISELECMGVLDGMNAYDSAILSGGPVHWTLGLGKDENGSSQRRPLPLVIYPGELCPALSFAAAEAPDEYHTFFGAFGLQPHETWTDPPTALYSSGQRKYRGWIELQDEHGNFFDPRDQRPETVPGDAPVPNNHDFQLIEVLHHWHWIYRWQMAPRAWQRLRTLMWDLARARIRALLTVPWPGRGLHHRRRLHLRAVGGHARADPRLQPALDLRSQRPGRGVARPDRGEHQPGQPAAGVQPLRSLSRGSRTRPTGATSRRRRSSRGCPRQARRRGSRTYGTGRSRPPTTCSSTTTRCCRSPRRRPPRSASCRG